MSVYEIVYDLNGQILIFRLISFEIVHFWNKSVNKNGNDLNISCGFLRVPTFKSGFLFSFGLRPRPYLADFAEQKSLKVYFGLG